MRTVVCWRVAAGIDSMYCADIQSLYCTAVAIILSSACVRYVRMYLVLCVHRKGELATNASGRRGNMMRIHHVMYAPLLFALSRDPFCM